LVEGFVNFGVGQLDFQLTRLRDQQFLDDQFVEVDTERKRIALTMKSGEVQKGARPAAKGAAPAPGPRPVVTPRPAAAPNTAFGAAFAKLSGK